MGSGGFAGDYHGHQEVLKHFGKLMQVSGGTFRAEIHDILANDTHGVVLANVHAENNGQVLTGWEVHAWHLADGKATAYWGMLEPHDAFDALLA